MILINPFDGSDPVGPAEGFVLATNSTKMYKA